MATDGIGCFRHTRATCGANSAHRLYCGMKIGKHDTDDAIFIIAELGNNAEGSFELARHMIHEAALAGADACKFQAIDPEHLADTPERLEQLRSICFPWDYFHGLRAFVRSEKMEFLVTPFNVAAVEFLDPLVPAWKIAARSNRLFGGVGDCDIHCEIAATEKPIIQSVPEGGSYWAEDDTIHLHVVSEYPCPPKRANLSRLLERDGDWFYHQGYSDHTIGIDACVGAAFLGARVIEKHFTTEAARKVAEGKKYKSNDHVHSATPDQFRLMVDKIRKAEILCSRPA